MKTDEFKDAIYYKADCDCGSDNHIATIEIEYDKDFGDISLNFYKQVCWSSHWGNYNWFERIWKQIKASIKILFTGWIELEESFLIRGGDQLDAFIEALEEGKNKFKNGENNGTV
jgi:hypothetical protein